MTHVFSNVSQLYELFFVEKIFETYPNTAMYFIRRLLATLGGWSIFAFSL